MKPSCLFLRAGAGAALLLLASCGSCSGTRPIVDVQLVGPGAGAGLAIDEALGRRHLGTAAKGLEGFSVRPAGDEEVGWQLTVRIQLATERVDDEDPSKLRRGLGASAVLRRLVGGEEGRDRFAAEVLEVRLADPGSSTDAHLVGTLDRLMGRLALTLSLAEAPPARVAEAVQSEDAFERAVAVRTVKVRSLAAAVPALEARMKDDQVTMQEALRIAGTLSTLGQPSSAGALIDVISRFPEASIPLIFLLGQIGGREAEAYLFTVRSGHQEPSVRDAARQALEEMSASPER